METRKLSLVFAISGFIYSTFLFFLFLILFGIYDLNDFFIIVKDYLPYLSVLIFFLAFVIGIIFELLMQKLIFLIKKIPFNAELEVKIMTNYSEDVRSLIYSSYDKLVILRHLISGLFLFALVFTLWIWSSGYCDKVMIGFYVLAPCILLILLALIAYILHRKLHIQFMDEIKKTLLKK